MKSIAPLVQFLFVLTQKWSDQALKGLREGGIRDIALVLVELARGKQATRGNQRLVQLIDDGGFSDSGIAGNQHQRRPAAGDDTIKRREEGLDLARSPVQLLRSYESILSVVLARWEIHDAPARVPFDEAAAKI